MARSWLKPSLRRLVRPSLPLASRLRQHRRQKLAGIAPRRLDDIFRRAPATISRRRRRLRGRGRLPIRGDELVNVAAIEQRAHRGATL